MDEASPSQIPVGYTYLLVYRHEESYLVERQNCCYILTQNCECCHRLGAKSTGWNVHYPVVGRLAAQPFVLPTLHTRIIIIIITHCTKTRVVSRMGWDLKGTGLSVKWWFWCIDRRWFGNKLTLRTLYVSKCLAPVALTVGCFTYLWFNGRFPLQCLTRSSWFHITLGRPAEQASTYINVRRVRVTWWGIQMIFGFRLLVLQIKFIKNA